MAIRGGMWIAPAFPVQPRTLPRGKTAAPASSRNRAAGFHLKTERMTYNGKHRHASILPSTGTVQLTIAMVLAQIKGNAARRPLLKRSNPPAAAASHHGVAPASLALHRKLAAVARA